MFFSIVYLYPNLFSVKIVLIVVFSEICQFSLPEEKLTWSGFGAWKGDDDG